MTDGNGEKSKLIKATTNEGALLTYRLVTTVGAAVRLNASNDKLAEAFNEFRLETRASIAPANGKTRVLESRIDTQAARPSPCRPTSACRR